MWTPEWEILTKLASDMWKRLEPDSQKKKHRFVIFILENFSDETWSDYRDFQDILNNRNREAHQKMFVTIFSNKNWCSIYSLADR